MRTLAIANYKGGVGKTTTAVNLAYNLAEMGFKVLLIDADQQGNATYIMTRRAYTGRTLKDVMQNQEIMAAVKRSCWSKNIDIVPATEDMETVRCAEDVLQRRLMEVRDRYDFCVIDCHPSMQIMTINALIAADDLIIPLKADRFSENGIGTMMDYLMQIIEYNPALNLAGCLFTMYQPRKSQYMVIKRMMAENYPIMSTVISDCEAVNSSQEYRKPLAIHRKNSKAAKEYKELAMEYVRHVKGAR